MIKIKNRSGKVILTVNADTLIGADLRGADLPNADLPNADLSNADLSNANLIGANLRGANLRGANLYDASLTGASLTGASLTGAIGLPEAPRVEQLDVKILAAIETQGNTLNMRAWHSCETTHCRAGWAIHLAGQAGYDLERRFGPSVAGALIYFASTGRIPNFYASNGEALADIRRCAEEQSK